MSQTISVVLATYNGERFLAEQLDSLLTQTHLPSQIIISDDDSVDATTEIIEAFAARSPVPLVRIRNTPARGFRDNFIYASLHASGDWIAFCDQDDIWAPHKLETCARYFSVPGVTQIAHHAELIDHAGSPIGRFAQDIAETGIRPPLHYDVWRTFFGFSMVFRRDLLEIVPVESRFVDYISPQHRIAHDRWVFFLAQVLGCTAEIAEPLVRYRQHSHNLYGAAPPIRSRESRMLARGENLPYIEATAAMVRIIEALPEDAEARFPAFDRRAAQDLYRAAYAQVCARGTVYDVGGARGVARVFSNLALGHYRRAESSGQRWRSVARDLLYCVSSC
jgi:glycosyltransferase involved in cell wall biosynthesis